MSRYRLPLFLLLLSACPGATPAPSSSTAPSTTTATTTAEPASSPAPAPAKRKKGAKASALTETSITRYVSYLERVNEALAREATALEASTPDGRQGLAKIKEELTARIRHIEEEARVAVGLDADAIDELVRLADDFSGIELNLERARGDEIGKWRAARDGMLKDRGAEVGRALTTVGERLTHAYVGGTEARAAVDRGVAALSARPFVPPVGEAASIEAQLTYVARHLELTYAGCRSATVTTVRERGVVRLSLSAPCRTPEAQRGTIEVHVESNGSGKPPIWSIEAVGLELGELSVTGPLFRGRATSEGLESDGWSLSRCHAHGEPRSTKVNGTPPECSAVPPTGNRLQLSMCIRARRSTGGSGDPMAAIMQGVEAVGAAAQAAFVLGSSETVAFRALCAGHGLAVN